MLDQRRPGVARQFGSLRGPRGLLLIGAVRHHDRHRSIHTGGQRRHHVATRAGRGTVAQDGGGHRDDLGGTPVVLVQTDHLGAPQELGEAVQQRGVGTVEAVDGLVRVAHDEEVGLVGEHRGQEPELRRVDVLHLVDEEVARAPADGIGELAVAGQGVGTGDDEVVEVEQPAAGPLLFVAGIGNGHLVGIDAAAATVPTRLGLVLLGGHESRFRPPDLAVEGARPAGVAGRHVGQHPAAVWQELGLGSASQFTVLVQQPECGAMERARLDPGNTERAQAGAQLVGCLAAECGDQGAIGLDRALAHPACHAEGEHPRLARARARDDTQEWVVGFDRLALGHGEAARTR